MVVESGLEQLANELSVRALEEQEAVLTELRARAGVLLAATALVASFLGARALSDGSLWLSAPGFLATLSSQLLGTGCVRRPLVSEARDRLRLMAKIPQAPKPPPPIPPGIFAPEVGPPLPRPSGKT
jgi:hypothetical protein